MKIKDKIIVMLIYTVMCGVVGSFGGYAINSLLPEGTSTGQFLFALSIVLMVFYGALILHIFVHETGHMICGLISGYGFSSIRFFNLMFVKLDGKICIKKHSIANTAGQCLMTPPKTDGTSPVRLYNWGGCLANVLLSGIAFIAAFFCQNVIALQTILFIVGVTGICMALINGIPLKTLSNDGYNAMTLQNRLHARKAFERSLLIVKETADGNRLKDMPAEWFDYEIGKYELNDNMLITMAILTLNYHMDCKNFDKGYELSKYLLEKISLIDVHKMIVISEMISCILVTDRDNAEIDKLLTDANKKLMNIHKAQPSVHRVWYAYELLYNRNEEKSLEHKKNFEKIAAKYPYPADIASDREFMKLVLQKYNKG